MKINQITSVIIGAAIKVHRVLGPGLLVSTNEECLCRDLSLRQIPFDRQRPLPVEYKGIQLDCEYRLDLLVVDTVVVEHKAVESLFPIHEAQLLTHLNSAHGKSDCSSTSTCLYLRKGSNVACWDLKRNGDICDLCVSAVRI